MRKLAWSSNWAQKAQFNPIRRDIGLAPQRDAIFGAPYRSEGGPFVLRQITISLGVLLVGIAPLGAQVMLDVSKLTCEQFAMYKVTNPKYLAVWLSGYDHGRRGDVNIDMQQVVANTEKLEAYCLKNPDVPMMQAVETILQPQR
jgi:acid stress chaperone HdeB